MNTNKITKAQMTALMKINGGASARSIHTTTFRALQKKGLIVTGFDGVCDYMSWKQPPLTDAGRAAIRAERKRLFAWR